MVDPRVGSWNQIAIWLSGVGKLPLNSLVGAIDVTNEDVESLLDHCAETDSHFLRKPRDLTCGPEGRICIGRHMCCVT